MTRSLMTMGLSCLLVSAVAAQEADDSRPAMSNLPGAQFPRVHADSRVTFRLSAPTAQQVQLVPGGGDNGLGAGPFDMTKDERGQWTVTTPPAVPGFHYYWLNVDGLATNDPATHTYFGWNKECSGIEIPDRTLDFYDLKDVPHGEVRAHWYHSRLTGMWRRALVYTPPGYDADLTTRYPVLYLQHGSGENERGWTEQGRANFIVDNLLAGKSCVPMMIVMENGMVAPRATRAIASASTPANRHNEAFADVVIHELVPRIDGHYRTVADRHHRAIAGLSMGAGQAMQIGFANLEKFAWIGAFSGGRLDRIEVGSLDPKPELIWVGAGSAEANRVTAGTAAVDRLKQAGLAAVWYEAPGTSHEWQTWRLCLREFAPRLFRDKR